AQDDLGVGLAVLLGQFGKDRLVQQCLITVAQGIPGYHAGAVLLQAVHRLGVGVVGVALELDDVGLDLGMGQQVFELFIMEVGDADGLDLAGLVGVLQLFVPGQVVAGRLVD